MKGEGRQHGVVRKGKEIMANGSGVVVNLARARAPLKPSNHSKHTGKCRKARCVHCHLHPVSKSRDKAKGSYKLKSSDVVLNRRLLTWRVAAEGSSSCRDVLTWNKYSGVSASGILDAVATSDSCYWSSEGGHNCEDQGLDYEGNYILEGEEEEEHEDNNEDEEEEEDADDADMGFCQVGMVW